MTNNNPTFSILLSRQAEIMNKFKKFPRNYLAWKAPDEEISLLPPFKQVSLPSCGNKKQTCNVLEVIKAKS